MEEFWSNGWQLPTKRSSGRIGMSIMGSVYAYHCLQQALTICTRVLLLMRKGRSCRTTFLCPGIRWFIPDSSRRTRLHLGHPMIMHPPQDPEIGVEGSTGPCLVVDWWCVGGAAPGPPSGSYLGLIQHHSFLGKDKEGHDGAAWHATSAIGSRTSRQGGRDSN